MLTMIQMCIGYIYVIITDVERLVIDEDRTRTPRRLTSPKTGKIVKRASPKPTAADSGGIQLSVGAYHF